MSLFSAYFSLADVRWPGSEATYRFDGGYIEVDKSGRAELFFEISVTRKQLGHLKEAHEHYADPECRSVPWVWGTLTGGVRDLISETVEPPFLLAGRNCVSVLREELDFYNASLVGISNFQWHLSEAEQKSLKTDVEVIRLPRAHHPFFFRRQVTEEEMKTLASRVTHKKPQETPHLVLFAVAYDNYWERGYRVATISLAASAEICIKHFLARVSTNDTVTYLLENIQSPPVSKLVAHAAKTYGLSISTDDRDALTKLAERRNKLVHGSSKARTPTLEEVDRWFEAVRSLLDETRKLLQASSELATRD